MKIARVFPTQTSMSPVDPDSYFGPPDLFTPPYDEIHISVVFTWDLPRAQQLKAQWEHIAPVKIGGPAIHGEPKDGFKAGMYLCKGVTITSRGCPNKCPWCFVNCDLIELDDFPEGNIIQDNNILACSKPHLEKVFQMLSKQRGIDFRGGLDSRLLKDWHIEKLRGLRIKALWLAYDHPATRTYFIKAITKLKKYFRRDQLRCYVLIGFGKDTIEEAEARLKFVWDVGALPFAMLYRNGRGDYPSPTSEWKRLQRKWARPAIYKSFFKED
jgi:hypothetical protein